MALKKMARGALLTVALLVTVTQGQDSRQSRRNESNSMFHQFPANSIECNAGDYIIVKSDAGRWKVYFVEDLFFFSRLVTVQEKGGLYVIEQVTLLDSATPPKWQEIQLLLTEFKREFQTPEQAVKAIQSGELGESIHGLCRGVDEFPKQKSQVYKK